MVRAAQRRGSRLARDSGKPAAPSDRLPGPHPRRVGADSVARRRVWATGDVASRLHEAGLRAFDSTPAKSVQRAPTRVVIAVEGVEEQPQVRVLHLSAVGVGDQVTFGDVGLVVGIVHEYAV